MFLDPQKNVRQLNLDLGMTVADIGAGTGFYTFEASKEVGETGKVYAIDIQKDLLSKIKNEANERNFKNVEIIWGDAEKENGTGLKNESVDVVIVSNIFFQVEDKQAFLKEVLRILKTKGKLLFIDWKETSKNITFVENAISSQEEVKNFLSGFSFLFEKEIPAGEYHYGFVFKKV